jgi:hypothetical protein
MGLVNIFHRVNYQGITRINLAASIEIGTRSIEVLDTSVDRVHKARLSRMYQAVM